MNKNLMRQAVFMLTALTLAQCAFSAEQPGKGKWAKPPSVDGYSTESVIASGQRGGDLEPVGTNFTLAYNRSMGQAMELWNAHRWEEALERFRQLYKNQPDSPWAAEAELHEACYLKYNAIYDEAEDRFVAVLKKYPSDQRIRKKALYYLPHLYSLTGRWGAAQDVLDMLKEFPMNWQEQQYFENYSRLHFEGIRFEEKERQCGSKAVALAATMDDVKRHGKNSSGVSAREIFKRSELAKQRSQHPDGYSIEDLADLAGGSPRFLSFDDLKTETAAGSPVVAYLMPPDEPKFYAALGRTKINGRNRPTGHFVVVRECHDDFVTLADPNFDTEYRISACEFRFRWKGHVLLLSGQQPAGRVLTKAEAGQLRGGCCGSPPPDPTGGRCKAATTGGGRNSPGGRASGPTGGGGCCGFGAPGYEFGIGNQNLILFDTPMWYPPAKGPGMRINLVYNRINSSSLASNKTTTYNIFGNKWSFNYSSFIKETPANNIQVVMEDGAQYQYNKTFGGDYNPADSRDRNTFARTNGYFQLTLDGSRTRLLYPTNSLVTNGQSLVKIVDRYSNEINLQYDGSGRLTNVVDSSGRYFAFLYNTNGLVTNVTDLAGRYCSFTYTNSNLETMRDMGGHTTLLEYNIFNWVTDVQYPNGGTLDFTYWTGAQLPWPYDQYTGEPFKMRARDSLNQDETYFYYAFDTMGPITLEDKGGNEWAYGIKRLPASSEYIDTELVNPFVSDFDVNELLVIGDQWNHRVYSLGGDITSWQSTTNEPPLESTMGYYHATTIDGPYHDDHFEREFDYDNHWAIKEVWKTGTVQYAFWTNKYDSAGNLTKRIDPQTNIFTAGYDTNDNLMAVTNALGDATRFTYNSDGFLTSVTNARAFGINFTYTNGLLTAAAFPDTTTVTMAYDALGRRATVTDPVGFMVSNKYDSLDRLVKMKFPDGSSFDYDFSCCGLNSISDRLGRATTFGYDILRRLTAVTNALGNAVSFGYEPLNNVTSLTWTVNSQARSIKYRYTSDNGFTRPTSRISPQGKTNAYSYTFRGWPLAYVDGNSRTSSYSYDAMGRLTRIVYSATTNATSDVVMAYDTLSRITSITDSNSTVALKYNGLSQVRTNTVSYAVPGFSNLSYELVYLYDKVGNVTNRQINRLGSVTNISTTAFTYDSLNRLLSVTDQYAMASYVFQTGRLASVSYGNSDITYMGYDSESRPISMITSNGANAVQGWYYQFDKMGMITGVTDIASNRWVYEYDAIYQLKKETYNSTNLTVWDYDEIRNRMSQAGSAGTRSYAYNADNEILWSSESTTALINVTGTVVAGSASNEWYDSWATTRGLSSKVDANNGNFTITNVPVGETNVLLVTVRDVSGNVASQTVSFTKTLTKTEVFGYDFNGNLTNWVVGSLTNQYFYDQQDRLLKVTSNGAAVLECWYDAIGRRIAKREVRGGQTSEVYYVYDGWSPMAVLDKAGIILEVYTRGSGIARDVGTLVAATYLPGAASATGTYYLLDNHRGDVTMVRSGSTTVASFDYRPFGETRASTGSIDLRFRFSSKELDQAVGLYYFGYRSYSPTLGRWIGQDPLKEIAGLNLYAFCANNPFYYADPLGLFWAELNVYGSMSEMATAGWNQGTFIGDVQGNLYSGMTALLDTIGGESVGNTAVNSGNAAGEGNTVGAIGWGTASAGLTVLNAVSFGKMGTIGAATKGGGVMEFSHWIPNRSGGPVSWWNGRVVTIAEHALNDPSRYQFMPRAWKALNPINRAWLRMINRMPDWLRGLFGIGAGRLAGETVDGEGCE